MIVKIRYAVIVIFYLTLGSLIPIFVGEKTCDDCMLMLAMLTMVVWVFGLLSTPWTYRKVFNKNKF